MLRAVLLLFAALLLGSSLPSTAQAQYYRHGYGYGYGGVRPYYPPPATIYVQPRMYVPPVIVAPAPVVRCWNPYIGAWVLRRWSC